jgi:hypothetical protein
MSRDTKLNLQLCAALLLVIVGCGLLIAGFVVAPLGIIHSSVLTAFGEACTFGGALFGVDYTYKYKIRNFRNNKNSSKEEQNNK